MIILFSNSTSFTYLSNSIVDSAGTTATATVTASLSDVDDNTPYFSLVSTCGTVPALSTLGKFICLVYNYSPIQKVSLVMSNGDPLDG